MKYFGDSIKVTSEIALCTLWDTFATPTNEDRFGQRCIWIFDLGKRELNSTVGKLFYQVNQFTLFDMSA